MGKYGCRNAHKNVIFTYEYNMNLDITRQHISNVKVNTVYQNYVGTVIQGYTNTPKRCGFLNLRTGIRVVKFRFLVDVLEQCLPLPLTLLTVCHALCICPHNIGRPKFL